MTSVKFYNLKNPYTCDDQSLLSCNIFVSLWILELSLKDEPKSEPIQRHTTPVIISTSRDEQ